MTAKSGRKPRGLPHVPPPFGDRRRLRIGLLGGSFNPAHEGHLHISDAAKRHLGLDQVWWLVSPQNPLKPAANMAPSAARLAHAQATAKRPYITVTDIERRISTARTAETLRALRKRYPGARFVWLMGADNLAQVPKWWRWTDIFRTTCVAVFDRSPYSYASLAGVAAQRFKRNLVRRPATIWFRSPPAWTYLAIRRHPASATALRQEKSAGNSRK